jgi:hypothetical protein
MNSYIRIAATRDMVCLRNISVDTLHTGDIEDDDDDDDDDNSNNVVCGSKTQLTYRFRSINYGSNPKATIAKSKKTTCIRTRAYKCKNLLFLEHVQL